jgi:hypothetical protein
MRTRLLFGAALAVVGLVLAGAGGCLSGKTEGGSAAVDARTPASSDTAAADAKPPIQAVTLDARRRPSDATLDSLQRLGATHVTLVSFGFQETTTTPRIEMHTDGGWYSESDAGIRDIAQRAAARDMGVILKPHLWVGGYDTEGQTRSEIGFAAEAQWAAWEADYRRFLLHYARLAAEVDADVLVVGTELGRATKERPGFWRGLIDSVRTVYDGHLTYAANWYDEYERIPFWKQLDYVGVQAYFPLTEAKDPPLDSLRRGWRQHCRVLERVHRETGRPVLFTELGYRSVGYAAAEPWRWPERDEEAAPNPALQARLYRAFFERVMPEPWMAGAILWKWHPADAPPRPISFTPQGKPAAQVIRRHFNAARSSAS